jgi:formylglycine-generating enzyme required for sulfatase activity
MARLFISYSRTEEDFARQLATSLSDMGADIWIDVEDIPAGMKWSSAIQQGLDGGDLLIVIISPDSMGSRNVEDEWQYYLDNGKPVIPVLLHPTKIHFQLSRIQYIDFHSQPYPLALRYLYVELKRKGIKLNPNITEPTKAYLPTPHQYPAVAQKKSNRLWIFGVAGAAIIALAVVAALALVAILTNTNPTTTPNPTTTAQVAQAATATDAPPTATTTATTQATATDLLPTPTTQATNTPPQPTATTVTLGYPGYPVTRNADWSPTVKTFDGMEMVLVPVGGFTMGIDEAQTDAAWQQCTARIPLCNRSLFEDERAQQRVNFERPFWIGRYEVTNAAYGSAGNFSGDNLPRSNVTWYDAQLYCQAKGARLPTEAEWEYAVRGPDSLTYPWGNNFDGSRLNYCDGSCQYDWHDANYNDGYAQLAPVGSYFGGASWVGALDMSGNLWEWTSTIYSFPYPYNATDGRENLNDINSKRVLRGGSWNWVAADTRTTARDDYAGENVSSDWYGFRCARDWQPGD